jgi:hypothetical protein
MSLTSFIKRALAGAILAGVSVAIMGNAAVSAAQIDYNNPNNQAITHARFNAYTNVPAVGNEADFVKLRRSSGDPTVSANASPFSDPLNDPCVVGQKFDVRTYVHNSANTEYNNNGNGTAVAKNVNVAMQAQLGVTKKNFTFSSTISASNAASVTDAATLNCGSDVQLKLVPTSVKVYSKNTGWNGAADSAVNGNLAIGSRTVGNGVVWGCWDDRVIVIYVVEVVKAPESPLYTCDLLTVTKISDRRYKFDVKYTARNGATFKEVRFDYGDGTPVTTESEHTFDKDGAYNVVATAVFTVNGQERTATGEACAKQVTVTPENCPIPGKENLPVDSDECVETPTVLPETGAAGLAGIFAAVSAAGAGAHQFVIRRRRS